MSRRRAGECVLHGRVKRKANGSRSGAEAAFDTFRERMRDEGEDDEEEEGEEEEEDEEDE